MPAQRNYPSEESIAFFVAFICLLNGNLVLAQMPSLQPSTPGYSIATDSSSSAFVDINNDLRPLFSGSDTDYFVSNIQSDADTARLVCQNLTSLTGKNFHLLIIEDQLEAEAIRRVLTPLNIGDIWLSGQKVINSSTGKPSAVWVTLQGKFPMTFKNFRRGVAVRKRRDLLDVSVPAEELEGTTPEDYPTTEGYELAENSDTAIPYPWLKGGSGKCKRILPPQCKPPECNVTVPDCTTTPPNCSVVGNSSCVIEKSKCSAVCENCTVVPPVCYAEVQNCTVKTPECQVTTPICSVSKPTCTTVRDNCTKIQPPCEQITTPTPCTTRKPCIPNRNCTSKGNKTTCEPVCPPPEICQTPAIICPAPIYFCPPERTVCTEPIVTCTHPTHSCATPEVYCPEPKVICSSPQTICSSPVLNCPAVVISCPSPAAECGPPVVTCPPAEVKCADPEPCIIPPNPYTCPPEEPSDVPVTEATTLKPCPGCGCVFMNQKYGLEWDIASCSKRKMHFICEG